MTHIPGHVGTTGSGAAGDLIGVKLFRPDGTFAGRLVQDPDKGLILKNEFGWSKFQGGTYLLEAGFAITVNAQGDMVTKEALAASTGTSSQQLASQQAADIAAMERLEAQLDAEIAEAQRNRDFEAAQSAIDRKADIAAAKLVAENALTQTLIAEGGALKREFLGVQSRARDVRAQMFGKNPFRGAIRGAGGVPRYVDPFQAFMAENQAVIDREAPTFGPSMTNEQLQAAISGVDLGTPSPQNLIGLGGGGVVRPGQAVRVGELGEPEIVVNRGDGVVQVIPERGLGALPVVASAQEGGEFQFDKSTIEQVLGPVFNYLGFSQAPTLGKSTPTSLADVNRLGVRPRLIKGSGNTVFFVDPQGVRHSIGSLQNFRDFGFSFNDVVRLNDEDLLQFQEGPTLTSAPPLFEEYRPFAPQAVPLRLPKELGGFALPSPRTFANLFRRFGGANRRIILDALGVSELQAEEALEEIRAFTPRGTARLGAAGLPAFG